MLAKEDFMVIQALTTRGVYQRDIAETLGVHPKTVQRALQRGGAPAARSHRRPSLLEPYRGEVDRLLAEGVWNAGGSWRRSSPARPPWCTRAGSTSGARPARMRSTPTRA